MEENDKIPVLEFLQEQRLGFLSKAGDRGILCREDLDHLEMPSGLSADETWSILRAMKRLTSVSIAENEKALPALWFSPSSALLSETKDLESSCKTNHPLYADIIGLEDSPLLNARLEGIVSNALAIEGISLSPERVHRLRVKECPEETAVDRAVLNYFEALKIIPEISFKDVTPGMLEMLHYLITRGIRSKDIPHRSPSSQSDENRTALNARRCIKLVCELANMQNSSGELFSPTLRIMCITWLFFEFEPFPVLSALAGILLRDFLAMKWGYGTLRWIPIPYGKTLGESPEGQAIYRDLKSNYADGIDLTNGLLYWTRSHAEEVHLLRASVSRLQELSRAAENILSFPMNERQAWIMSVICKNPFAEITIEEVMSRFHVVHSTARKDLVELESVGYLKKEKRERLYFYADPELRSRLVRIGNTAETKA